MCFGRHRFLEEEDYAENLPDLYDEDYALYRRAKENCWWKCSEKGGECPGFCPKNNACCRSGWADPPECKESKTPCDGFHCCSVIKPIDGGWSSYVKGKCSVTCGQGTVTSTRTCTSPAPKWGGKECVGSKQKKEACTKPSCPIYGAWSAWSPCSKPCNGGTRTHTRTCRYASGAACPTEKVTEACNKEACVYCSKQLEAGILLDRSGSVGFANWHKTIDFAVDFLKAFDISPYKVHYGVARFSTPVTRDIDPEDQKYWNNQKIIDKIKSNAIYNTRPSGDTWMNNALNAARMHWFCNTCGARYNVPKVVLLFTDGVPDPAYTRARALNEANALKALGVTVITVGIGPNTNQAVLNELATDATHVFNLAGFDYLKEKINQLVKVTCDV